MRQALARGLLVGGALSATYLASVVGWFIGRWVYFTFG